MTMFHSFRPSFPHILSSTILEAKHVHVMFPHFPLTTLTLPSLLLHSVIHPSSLHAACSAQFHFLLSLPTPHGFYYSPSFFPFLLAVNALKLFYDC